MSMNRIRVGDALIISVILVTALLLFLATLLPKEEGSVVEVTCGQRTERYSLDEDREVILNAEGYTLVLTIKDGEAAITASDCPDKVCLHHGKIGKAGETVICVPSGISFRVLGGDANGDDAIAG